jgi:tetratricopeptide (TPR) repeat protein
MQKLLAWGITRSVRWRLSVCSFAVRFLCALALGSGIAQAQFHDPRALDADPSTAIGPLAPRLSGLGDAGFDVTTTSKESQYFFNQGLRLTYAFNHSEALRSFKEAARLDPNNAMAWWGQALVLGPNINLPMMPYVAAQTWQAMQRAVELEDAATEKERELIDALALRYASPELTPDGPVLSGAYAEAMQLLAAKYPGDPDIAALTASAIMNLSPWDYWYGDGTPYQRTLVVLELLQQAIAKNPQHTGVLHYYIHITEAYVPQQGEPAADLLSGLAPNAGHLVHMPAHIYMRVGRYADAYAVNLAASQADNAYIAACQAQGLYPIGYYPHNVHFLVWSAQAMGRYEDALAAAEQISEKIPAFVGVEDQLPGNVQADAWRLFETFLSQPLFTMVRFGDWQAVLRQPQPASQALFMTGVWHYARGLAFTHTGKNADAVSELTSLQAILGEPGIGEYPVSLNGAGRLLQIAAALLAGEIAAANEEYDAAIGLLELAVRLQDGLLYMEPPDWFMPARHYLGAVLLEAGWPAEAETVYWADLRKNPNNGYALFGLWQAQQAQGKDGGAVKARFSVAWANADHELSSSRY